MDSFYYEWNANQQEYEFWHKPSDKVAGTMIHSSSDIAVAFYNTEDSLIMVKHGGSDAVSAYFDLNAPKYASLGWVLSFFILSGHVTENIETINKCIANTGHLQRIFAEYTKLFWTVERFDVFQGKFEKLHGVYRNVSAAREGADALIKMDPRAVDEDFHEVIKFYLVSPQGERTLVTV